MNISLVLLLFSIGALGSAYTAQYGFGLMPCVLCLYQRIPFFVVIVLSAISFFAHGKLKTILISLCALALLTGAGIAFYHTGVEKHWFYMDGGCAAEENTANSLEELRNQLIGKPNIPCDKPAFLFLGLSMATWNFIFSLVMGVYTAILSLKISRLSPR